MNGNDFIRLASQQHRSMVFVICTGSPEYHLPEELQKLPAVCNDLFNKPLTNFQQMKVELHRLTDNRDLTGMTK